MNIIILLGIALWFIAFSYFLYVFFKNDLDLSRTWNYFKNNIFKCCLDKKKVAEKVGVEMSNEIESDMTLFDDCKKPIGFPLDICMSEELVKEEILIREKLLKILKEQNAYTVSDGIKKLKIPLESTLFLTKSLNPLVNEMGEIQITARHRPVAEHLESLILEMKSNGELVYQDEAELMETIKSLLEGNKPEFKYKEPIPVHTFEYEAEHSEKQTKTLEIEDDIHIEIAKEKEISVPLSEIKETPVNHMESPLVIKKDEKDEDDLRLDIIDIEDTIEDIDGKSPFDDNQETPFDENEEDIEIDFSAIEDEIDMELNDLLSDSLNSFEEESKDDNKKDFYVNLSYKTYANYPLDFSNLTESIHKLFGTTDAIGSFFRNLAKTTPIIMSNNKEFLFVDQINVYFAISKLFGMEAKTYQDQFVKMKKEQIVEINEAISNSLELYLSDLMSGTKTSGLHILENKDGGLFKSFGFCFQTNAFKTGLSHKEFDFFRSFPYDTDYKIKQAGGATEITSNCSKLTFDYKTVEIK